MKGQLSPQSEADVDAVSKPSYKCLSKLGTGAYATVWLAIDQSSGDHVAVKVVSEPKFFAPTVYEYNITSKLMHPNICKTRACFKTQNQTVMLVQDYACGGDLFNKVVPEMGMKHSLIRRYFAHLLDAVAYLHLNGIVHRDIKPENVLVNEHDIAQLCDFGMADYAGRKVTHGSGTGPYMAVEICSASRGFTAKLSHDIWALGVTLFVLLTGDFPWMKATMEDEEFRSFVFGDSYHGPWASLHPHLRLLLSMMWAPEESRCTIDVVITTFSRLKSFTLVEPTDFSDVVLC